VFGLSTLWVFVVLFALRYLPCRAPVPCRHFTYLPCHFRSRVDVVVSFVTCHACVIVAVCLVHAPAHSHHVRVGVTVALVLTRTVLLLVWDMCGCPPCPTSSQALPHRCESFDVQSLQSGAIISYPELAKVPQLLRKRVEVCLNVFFHLLHLLLVITIHCVGVVANHAPSTT